MVKLQAYWVNTSDNALIYENLSVANMDVFNCLEKLFEGKEIKKRNKSIFLLLKNWKDIMEYGN